MIIDTNESRRDSDDDVKANTAMVACSNAIVSLKTKRTTMAALLRWDSDNENVETGTVCT